MARVLEEYARRGVFRGFSGAATGVGKAAFRMLWHRDRPFELAVDTRRRTLRVPVVLPDVAAKSAMQREYREFVRSRQWDELPAHRRIDPKKARVACANRNGAVGLTLRVEDGDYEYGARKLVGLVHETYLEWLMDGRYYEYLMEAFGLDPDRM